MFFTVLELTPESHMEIGCPGALRLELLTPNTQSGSKRVTKLTTKIKVIIIKK